jgi:threonine dehydrogenase-like Zn-dependent dehydrogenase
MRAVVISGPNRLEYREDVPKPAGMLGEVLVRVKAVGICRTDIELLEGKHPFVRDSAARGSVEYRIPGHEWSGIVDAPDATSECFEIGDQVVSEVGVRCDNCIYCKGLRQGVCQNLEEIGITRNGAMAEYVSVPCRNLHVFRSNISFKEAALIEPATVVIRSLRKIAAESESLPKLDGQNVMVFGDGPIGLLSIKALRLTNAARVIIVGKSDDRLDLAKRFGCDVCINTSSTLRPPADIISEHIRDLPIDVVVEAAGGGTVVNEALSMIRAGGTLVLLGLHGTYSVDLDKILTKEIRVVGSLSGSEVWDQTIDLVSQGSLTLGDVITDELPLDRAIQAFQWTKLDGGKIKTILTP